MKKFLAAILILVAFSARPAAADMENIRLYKVYWERMNVGEMVIKINQTKNIYRIETNIRAKGIAKTISGYTSDTVSNAMINNGKAQVISFSTDFELRGKRRVIEIKYAPDGSINLESNNPPEDREKRPEVAKNKKAGSYDPLSIAILLREKLREMRSNGQLDRGQAHFTIPMYDGRRRSDLKFTIYGRETVKIDGKEVKTIHIGFINEPVVGYTQNEIRNLPTQNPVINAYISDDELLLPVKGDGETRIGFAYGEMVKECHSFKGCGINF